LLMYVLPNFSQVPITYDTYLAVFKGNGAGAFSSSAGAKSLALTGKPALGDFNGDGNLDVGMAEFTGKIDLFLGDGNGNLAAPLAYGDQGQAAIASADFNHDGYPDIVTSFNTTPRIWFGGVAGLSAPSTLTATQYAGLMVASADVNGDGNPDIA